MELIILLVIALFIMLYRSYRGNNVYKYIVDQVSVVYDNYLQIYIYVCNISMLPNNIILMQGEPLKLNTVLGINIKKHVSKF